MQKHTMLSGLVVALTVGAFAFFVVAVQPTIAPQVPATSPVEELRLHLVGVHVIKAAQDRQYVAHHYCQQLSSGVIQCAVFDSDGPEAKLVDVEYVVSGEVYQSFSPEEQQYWHPHTYEVEAGLLRAPDLLPEEERALLDAIRTTYGRTWHLWASKEDPLPLGEPELTWSITGPGQLREDIQEELGQ